MNYVVHDLGRIVLRRVTADVVHPIPQAELRTEVFVVRVKDVPRILGHENTRLRHISQQSGGALIAVSVDLRGLLNQCAYFEVTGNGAQVRRASRLIKRVIMENYDDSRTRLAVTLEYILHEEMVLPLYKAIHLLKQTNLVEIEDQSSTWIEVDATKARRARAPKDVTLHFFGAKRGIDDAMILVDECVAHAKKPAGTLKKVGRVMATGSKASSRFVWNGMRTGSRASGRLVWNVMRTGSRASGRLVRNGMRSVYRKWKDSSDV